MTEQEKIRLRDQAKELLDNPAWHYITNQMMDALQLNWSECKDAIVREDLWHKQNALAELIGEFETAIMNGDIAEDA